MVGESGSSDYVNRGDLPYFNRLSGCFAPSRRILKSLDRAQTLDSPGNKRRVEARSSITELQSNMMIRQVATIHHRSRDSETFRLPSVPAGPQLHIKPRHMRPVEDEIKK